MALTDYTTWLDYYRKVPHGAPGSATGLCDSLVENCLNDDEKFLNSILENSKVNIILVPSPKKGHLECVHHCSVHEDDVSGSQIVIGTHGTRFASPWKEIPLDKANIPLKPPSKRKHPSMNAPSLDQFKEVESASDFVNTVGEVEARN